MSKRLREKVAENIKEMRIQLGMSQVELARRSKLTDVYISRVEKQARNLTLDSLEQIAIGLDVPITALIKAGAIKKIKPNKKTAESLNHAIKILKAYLETVDS